MSLIAGKSILILDVGSTSARAFVIETQNFNIVGCAKYAIELIQTDEGHCEINPDELFNNIVIILRDALKNAQIEAKNLLCLGISVQRATFTVLDKVTGEPFVPLISWNDKRANKRVEKINKSLFIKFINYSAIFLYWMTHKNIFKQGSNVKILNNFIAPRLSHILKNNTKLKEAMNKKRAALCTVDTWLLNKLKNFSMQTTNFECITDISNASATGLYDAFNLEYNAVNLKLFGIKRNMVSTTVSNSHDFGFTHTSLLGTPVRIGVIIADQAASLIGNACFHKMDAKITLGTGTFLNVNTGGKCRGSRNGANPMIAWNIQSREKGEKLSAVYYTERSFNESSTLIHFAKTVGLCSSEDELSSLAFASSDSDGVIFIPKFYSLAGFIGYKQSTTRNHLVRAILESIVFKVAQFFFLMREENSDYRPQTIRIDGGISANDFICQSIADLLNISIERGVNSSEITSLGCAYLAAHNCGVFEKLEHAVKFYKIEKVFAPIESNHRELFERFKRFIDIYAKFS